MIYPKDITENKKYRLKVLNAAANDDEFKKLVISKCEKDILFYINTFAYTYDPRKIINKIPFITYPFQDKYIEKIVECIENGIDNSTEKSRDMGFSWMIVVIATWGLLFKGRSGLLGSYKQDKVDRKGDMDSLFEKIRYTIDLLPNWLKPDDLLDKYMSIGSKKLGCEVSGDCGENFGTGGRRKYVFMDEFALWDFDKMAFRKTKDIANCRIIGGTPEGRNNVYGKIMTGHEDFKELKIKKFRLHWKLHPNKDDEWYQKEKGKRTKLDVAKELDISYEDSITGSVYPNIDDYVHYGNFKYDANYSLFTSWDFGKDANAIIWIQKDYKTGMNYIIDAVQREGRNIEKMAAFVTGKPTPGFEYTDKDHMIIGRHRGRRYNSHFGDPYNSNSTTVVTDNTIVGALRKHGIYISNTKKKRSTVQQRIERTTLSLWSLCINYNLIDFIEAIKQSKYPQRKNENVTKENNIPLHDKNSHYRTALEYYIDNEPKFDKTKLEVIKASW